MHPETAELNRSGSAEVQADSANNSQHSSEEQSKLNPGVFLSNGPRL